MEELMDRFGRHTAKHLQDIVGEVHMSERFLQNPLAFELARLGMTGDEKDRQIGALPAQPRGELRPVRARRRGAAGRTPPPPRPPPPSGKKKDRARGRAGGRGGFFPGGGFWMIV